MKIAVITSGILPVPSVLGGAVETLIEFYLEENDKQGEHQFTVYSVYDDKIGGLISQYKHTNFRHFHVKAFIYRVRKKLFQYFSKPGNYNYHIEFFLHNVLKDIAKQDFDAVIVENRPGYILPLSRVTDAKIILHLHNDLLNAETPLAKETLNKCHKVLTVSDYIKGRVSTIDESDKIVTVHNGIDLEAFRNAKPIARATLGLSEKDFVLVFSGRLNPNKGIKELLEAMLQLRDKPNIKLLVIGGSFFGNETRDNDFVKSLKEIAAPLKDRIVFTGFVPYSDVPSYLATANVAVVPSMWDDPFPTSVLEAMAIGLPVIATRFGGIPEEVDANCSIMLERKKVVERLSKSIMHLHSSPSFVSQMQMAALQRSSLFEKQRYAKDILNTIQ